MQPNILKCIFSPEYLKNILSLNYNLPQIMDISLLQSNINDTYKIVTSQKKYILKIFNVNKRMGEIKFEIEFILFLKNHNIDVSYPIKTNSNMSYMQMPSLENYRIIVLYSYLEGKELLYDNINDAYLYGQNIAKLHLISQKFKPSRNIKYIDIKKVFYQSSKIVLNFIEKYYFEHYDFFKNSIENLSIELNQINFDKMNYNYIHGDLHGGNSVYTSPNKLAFFDFDFCGYGLVDYELAVFKWACILGNREKDWEHFLNGYKSLLKFDCSNLELLFLLVKIRDIHIMSNYIKQVNTLGHLVINNNYIRKRIEFLKNSRTQ